MPVYLVSYYLLRLADERPVGVMRMPLLVGITVTSVGEGSADEVVVGVGLADVVGVGLPVAVGNGEPEVVGEGLPLVVGEGDVEPVGEGEPDVVGAGLCGVPGEGCPEGEVPDVPGAAEVFDIPGCGTVLLWSDV